MSLPTIDPNVAQCIAEGACNAALEHQEVKRKKLGDGQLSACPEARGPFMCSATIHTKAVSPFEVEVEATILYPGDRKVIFEAKGDFGLSIASDGTFHVAGLLGLDPDQLVGELAFSLGGASTGIGVVNFALMKSGCFAGDMFGIAFGAGAFAIVGKGTARLG